MENYYTAHQVANLLNVHYNTVMKWVRSGQLEVTRITGCIRISEAQLNKLLGKGGK